ncbi:MAG: peptide chain release factor N(5)-glutamine methyltransferase [Oscillospiraceae bacterium]|nr:peptide chain release factor N(5)-glutamine methyltransferase [Oscillospiraceae bacterium]
MPKTYNDMYIRLRQGLKDAGVEAHSLEARLIIAAAAGKTQAELLRDMQLYTSSEVEAKAAELARRALSGEPVAYVTGAWSFYGVEFKITHDVLIPRTDTEVLVQAALDQIPGRDGLRILDLCTGSGCVGCAMAHTLPRSRVVLVDNDEKALAVAQENVWRLGLADRVECLRMDVNAPPPADLGSFDLILANPPYVPTGELAKLDASVREYEPWRALDGGPDGLDCVRAILKNWVAPLRQSGRMLLEIGEDQAQEVFRLMRQADLHQLAAVQDTQGCDRVVLGKK